MPIPDFFGELAIGFVPRVGGHLEDGEALLLHRHTWCALAGADKERTGHMDAQQAILAEDRHADLERLQLTAAGIQQGNREEHFTLDLVDGRHIQFLDQTAQALGRLVALQADRPAFPAIGIHQRNILLGVVLGETVQAVGHHKANRVPALLLLENHFMTIQVPEVMRLPSVLERLPLGDRVHVKFRQTLTPGKNERASILPEKIGEFGEPTPSRSVRLDAP